MRDLKLIKEQIDNCRKTANSMLNLIRMYQKQDDRGESIKQCAREGKRALLLVKELEQILKENEEEVTNIINIAA
jgi:gas vesicle protein